MIRAGSVLFVATGVSAGTIKETVYRITPRNYTGLTNLDTGDAAGDAFFGLYEKSAPVVCANQTRENILCENDALLQIPGFNVYIAVDVEFDDRFGDYAECNPLKELPHTFNCTHWHHGRTSCWNKNYDHPEWADDFKGVCDERECVCDAVETLSVGREFPKFGKPLPPAGFPAKCSEDFYPIEGYANSNSRTVYKTMESVSHGDCCGACAQGNDAREGTCGSYTYTPSSATDPYSNGTCILHGHTSNDDLSPAHGSHTGWFQGDDTKNFVETASMSLSNIMNGSWYSTQEAGMCHAGQTVGEDCWWKVIEQKRSVNATCVNDRMIDKVVSSSANGDCFNDCADPKDQNSACWIHCFFETIIGNASKTPPLPATKRELILDAFEAAFDATDGCPEVPECPEPCLPPCWGVPAGDPCTDSDDALVPYY